MQENLSSGPLAVPLLRTALAGPVESLDLSSTSCYDFKQILLCLWSDMDL